MPPARDTGREACDLHHGLIVHPTYRVRGNVPVVQLYGRLEDGRSFLVEDDRFRPYFYVATRDREALRTAEVDVRDSELIALDDEPLVRVNLSVPAQVRPLRERLAARGVRSYEADIRFVYRYLMDQALHSAITIEGGRPNPRGGMLVFRNPELSSSDRAVALRHLSIDLETTPSASEIFSVALAGCGIEEVHLVSREEVKGALSHPDERTLLTAVAARIRELDPDLLLGWNVVDFDLRVFAGRCGALDIPTQASSLGRIPGPIDFTSDPGFTRQTRATIEGRMVLDGIPLVRDALRLDSYRLGDVARELLGKGKLIADDVPDAAQEISRLYRDDPEALVAYNLEDARLVNEILEREGLLALTLERSLLSGMQMDRVGASIASFDLLYLPELRRHGRVAPNVESDRESEGVHGGAVLEPEPGLLTHVGVYDFKSLYPSLIRTFNIDPLALALGPDEPAGAPIVAPNGARLSRSDAILPHIIERFMQRREAARKRGDRHASQAIKIMMNSMFGIFAAPACRFFDPMLANAITSFGQQTLAWTCEAFEQEGMTVLYGDTDSVFVELPDRGDAESIRMAAERLRETVAKRIAERIAQTYDVDARLDLELEKIFSRFFLPRVRGAATARSGAQAREGGVGSKKRYAGWVAGEERLEIVGLESVRRDWPTVTRRLQQGMLWRLFHDEELIPFVREVVDAVKAGDLDDELVYSKGIRKGSLDRYTASSPPHIQAARKLEAQQGGPVRGTIRYVITREGPEPLRPGEGMPRDLDYRHYVERVLRPVADTILIELGASFDEVLGEPRQLPLL